jgi:hypothetical protein
MSLRQQTSNQNAYSHSYTTASTPDLGRRAPEFGQELSGTTLEQPTPPSPTSAVLVSSSGRKPLNEYITSAKALQESRISDIPILGSRLEQEATLVSRSEHNISIAATANSGIGELVSVRVIWRISS